MALQKTLGSTRENINGIFIVNTFGAIFLTQAVIPHMPPGGRIINISSVFSKLGLEISPIYNASKAAMDSLTYTWAKEFGGNGITVNCIAPGPLKTDLAPEGVLDADPKIKAAMISIYNMTRATQRLGTTQDIADAVLLIADEKSRWITVQFISASGGINGQ